MLGEIKSWRQQSGAAPGQAPARPPAADAGGFLAAASLNRPKVLPAVLKRAATPPQPHRSRASTPDRPKQSSEQSSASRWLRRLEDRLLHRAVAAAGARELGFKRLEAPRSSRLGAQRTLLRSTRWFALSSPCPCCVWAAATPQRCPLSTPPSQALARRRPLRLGRSCRSTPRCCWAQRSPGPGCAVAACGLQLQR